LIRLTAVEPADINPELVQYKPKLRYVLAELFPEKTYILAGGNIITIPAANYLVKDGTAWSVVPQATFEAQWDLGP
jgi:hypothetical protein